MSFEDDEELKMLRDGLVHADRRLDDAYRETCQKPRPMEPEDVREAVLQDEIVNYANKLSTFQELASALAKRPFLAEVNGLSMLHDTFDLGHFMENMARRLETIQAAACALANAGRGVRDTSQLIEWRTNAENLITERVEKLTLKAKKREEKKAKKAKKVQKKPSGDRERERAPEDRRK